MSVFGFYFVSGLMREAGWPRKQGLFRKEVLDTTILDSAIDQMIDWAAGLGAGRPTLALQTIAEMFGDRDWSGDSAPNIKKFVEGSRTGQASSQDSDPIAPHEVVQPTRFAPTGSTVPAKALTDMHMLLEQLFLEGVLLGIGNPKAFEAWYQAHLNHHAQNLDFMRRAGLAVEGLPDLMQFFADSEEILQRYALEIGPLPAIPGKLLADAKALGRHV